MRVLHPADQALRTTERQTGRRRNRRRGSHNSHLQLRDVSGFTIHPFEGNDFIIQTVPARPRNPTEFAIAHRLAEGVWQVVPIDEADADAATRDAYCKSSKNVCVIETRQQLVAFARATAAQRKDDGGLAIRLPDTAARKPTPHRR